MTWVNSESPVVANIQPLELKKIKISHHSRIFSQREIYMENSWEGGILSYVRMCELTKVICGLKDCKSSSYVHIVSACVMYPGICIIFAMSWKLKSYGFHVCVCVCVCVVA